MNNHKIWKHFCSYLFLSVNVLIIDAFIYYPINDMNGSIILIDPGHGGDDEGATKQLKIKNSDKIHPNPSIKVFKEKDLSLSISKKIYEELKKNYTVYLTRSFDRTVSLSERSEMAEKVKADLFISIHVNSGPDIHAKGHEVYYLDNHNNQAVWKVEKEENKRYQSGENEENVINHILIDLVIDKTVEQSKKLAYFIDTEIKENGKKSLNLSNRGVRPGLFYVLALSKRPSVLLEVGFISNDNEVLNLNSSQFQDNYAKAVAKAIKNYVSFYGTKN